MVFTRERLFTIFMCVRLFMLFIWESLLIVSLRKDFMLSNLNVQCIKVK